MLLFVILIAAIALYNSYDNIQKWLYQQKFRHIPGPPADSFSRGHALTLGGAKSANSFLEVFLHWRDIYGDTFKFYIKTRPVIFSVDPDVLRSICQDVVNFVKVDHLPNRSLFGQRITGTYSILTGGGQEWAMKRKVMSSVFAKQNMKLFAPKLIGLMDRLLNRKIKPKVGTGVTLDIHELYSMIFSAIPGVAGFECDMGVNQPEEIGRIINIFLDVIPHQLGNLRRVWGLQAMSMKNSAIKMVKDMRAMGKEMIAEKRKEIELLDGGEPPLDDLLAYLIIANDTAGLTDEEVTDDIMTVYLVMDNMSKQLGSMFIYLINYPEIYQKMAQEIRDNPITDYRSISKLKYTELVILESLRMSPVLLRGTRWLNKGVEVGGYKIPGDCQFQYSQYVLHRIEKYWTKPREFIPERFENGVPNVESFSYFPFLAGARACLGKHLAIISMKLALSMLLSNFDLTPVPQETAPMIVTSMAVTRLKGGPFYEFKPLSQLVSVEGVDEAKSVLDKEYVEVEPVLA